MGDNKVNTYLQTCIISKRSKMKLSILRAIKTMLIPLMVYPLTGSSQQISTKSIKINFIENSWPEALKKAEAEHKYIFVDAYAVWCGPCLQLKATTFKNSKVAAFFNRNFINLTIDAEKGEGVKLASKWGLESFPTLYIFDSKGKLVSTNEGFVDAADLMKFGESVLATR